MKKLISTVPLYDRHSGEHVEAELYDTIDEGNVRDFETLWRPLLDSVIEALRPSGLTAEAIAARNASDAHWRWGQKVAVRIPSLVWRSFAIECEGQTQGLMLVKLSHLARAAEQAGRDSVYIDLLSAAPWNRPKTTDKPRFGNIGRILLATAISLSTDDGLDGRIALHSLPQSEEWYRDKCLMTDLGIDPHYQNLRYFEMTAAQATAFIS